MSKKITIVGAGLVGSLEAIFTWQKEGIMFLFMSVDLI